MSKRGISLFWVAGCMLACAVSAVFAEEAKRPAPAAAEESESAVISQADRLKARVDLSFTNADLKNVLSSLAKVYGLNIVAPDSVTGTVTLTLKGVTLEEGLRQLLKLNGFGFVTRGEIIEVVRLEEERVAEVLAVRYLNPDTALEFLQPMASEKATLKVDEASSGILVNDFMNKIEGMKVLLSKIDQPPRQVMIESKLIDITHSDLDNLGISLSDASLSIPIKGGSLPIALSAAALDLAGPSSTLTNDELAFTVGRGDDTLTATIDALIRNQRVKVIATPSVLTVNNVEAKIIIGEKFPIREQTQTTTGTLETTRFVDVGTTLRVTPRIDPDGYIQMHIHPEVSSVSATLDEGPRITTREADTTVHVKDGQPVVIAGLLQQDETRILGRIPILGHIPFLGLLFQNRSKDHSQKELVVVITPRIVNVTEGTVPSKISPEVAEVSDRLEIGELFAQGRALENKTTVQSRQMPDVLRHLKAASLYDRIVDRFPSHPLAIEALWRLGRVSREELHDLDRAEAAYRRLMSQFPKSNPHLQGAKRQIRLIQLERERKAGRFSARSRTVDKAGPESAPQSNIGFR